MAGFTFAYSTKYGAVCRTKPLTILSSTVIKKAAVVAYNIVSGVVTFTAAFASGAGVALERHNATTETGLTIKVNCDPYAVYKLQRSQVLTATSGSTSYVQFSTRIANATTNGLLAGGMLEVYSCTADSTMKGTLIPITSHAADSGAAGTGKCWIGSQTAAFASGDLFIVHPGRRAIGFNQWQLTASGDDVDMANSGGTGVQLVDAAPEQKLSFWRFVITPTVAD